MATREVSYRFVDTGLGGFRQPDGSGRLTGLSNKMMGLNRRYAKQLQDELVKSVEEARRLPKDRRAWRKRGTHYLAEAFADPQNSRANYEGFMVGNTMFLDHVNPYWRAQDQGSSASVGRRLYGSFEGGLFTPAKRMAGDAKKRPRGFVIREPIAANRYFDKVVDRFKSSGYEAEMDRILSEWVQMRRQA